MLDPNKDAANTGANTVEVDTSTPFKPAKRTDVVGGRTLLNCDCGMSYKLRDDVDYSEKPALCRRCYRVYRRLRDGSFRMEKHRADPSKMVRVKDILTQGQIDKMLGLDKLMADPNDSMHVFTELLRAGGVLPTSPGRVSVDRVRQVWRAIKKANGSDLNQELAHAMDVAIDLLDREPV